MKIAIYQYLLCLFFMVLFIAGMAAAQISPSTTTVATSASAPATASPALTPASATVMANAVTPAPATQPTSQATPDDAFFRFYATNLRSIFFTGCLTLSSFLLAATTFIIINLKKEVYDSPGYRENVINAEPGTSHYGPLRRLSRLLIFNITLALLASVLQVTVGILWATSIGATVCISSVGLTVILLFVTLAQINFNLRDWFDNMEKQAAAPKETK